MPKRSQKSSQDAVEGYQVQARQCRQVSSRERRRSTARSTKRGRLVVVACGQEPFVGNERIAAFANKGRRSVGVLASTTFGLGIAAFFVWLSSPLQRDEL